MPTAFEPKRPGTVFLEHQHLSKFPELVCKSPGYILWADLQFTWVNFMSWSAVHLCLSLHNHRRSALFKSHLIMQFNCSKNNSFAEYATVSSLYFDGGREKEKAISFKVQAFLWGLSDVKRQRPLCLRWIWSQRHFPGVFWVQPQLPENNGTNPGDFPAHFSPGL